MKINITQLFLFFDELMPVSNEEQGIYWFKTTRDDGIVIMLIISVNELHVSILIGNNMGVDIAKLSLGNCSEINMLEKEKKCLEVLHSGGHGRCFLSLIEGSIVQYETVV